MMTRDDILNALTHWVNQRPGLEPANYGDFANYRSEGRRITRQLRDARTLLAAVRWRTSIGVDELKEAFRAYSGRLTLRESKSGGAELSYCTGQYWPTEYRAAACAVLASALWDYQRACMPSKIVRDGRDYYPHVNGSKNELSAGDWIRAAFKKEFGAHIQRRLFD